MITSDALTCQMVNDDDDNNNNNNNNNDNKFSFYTNIAPPIIVV